MMLSEIYHGGNYPGSNCPYSDLLPVCIIMVSSVIV